MMTGIISKMPGLLIGLIATLVMGQLAEATPDRDVGADSDSAIRRISAISYLESGDEKQKLDLYLPSAPPEGRLLPLVIWIHGGGFSEGGRGFCPIKSLVDHGYIVASISYRLAPKSTFPAQIEDVRSAIRWLRAHAGEFAIDPDRFGVCGESAGGQLAALAGVLPDEPEGPGVSARVQAVVALCPGTDMTVAAPSREEVAALLESDDPEDVRLGKTISHRNQLIADFLGGPLAEHPDLAKQASPRLHVSKDDPPFLLVHGDQDILIPISQSELLVEALRLESVPAEFHVVPGAGHGFGRPPEPLLRRIREFFDSWLKSK